MKYPAGDVYLGTGGRPLNFEHLRADSYRPPFLFCPYRAALGNQKMTELSPQPPTAPPIHVQYFSKQVSRRGKGKKIIGRVAYLTATKHVRQYGINVLPRQYPFLVWCDDIWWQHFCRLTLVSGSDPLHWEYFNPFYESFLTLRKSEYKRDDDDDDIEFSDNDHSRNVTPFCRWSPALAPQSTRSHQSPRSVRTAADAWTEVATSPCTALTLRSAAATDQ